MNRNMKIKFTLIALVVLSLIPNSIFSQSSSIELKRKAEIQAVKSYFEMMKLKSPTAVENTSTQAKDYNFLSGNKLSKSTALKDRKHYFMNGNSIKTEIYNYGGIAPGYNLLRNVNNGVWKKLGYIFQFSPFAAASVPDSRDTTKRLHIVSDGLNDYPSLIEVNPNNRDSLWLWSPIPGYADPDQPLMASIPAEDKDKDGKPDSWPRSWYNPSLGKYVWPGYLAQDVDNADLEVFWAMDDRENAEFPYYPFVNDSSRRGIGLQVDGRALQWSNALAENAIFFIYTITNVSDKDLDTVFFGIYGDPDVGGGSPENVDDNGFFIPPYNYDGQHDVSKIPVYARSMTYFWDPDMKGDYGYRLGYVACKFLESPGNPNDGIDNDGDGMIDERQDDGIDNDKDWNPVTDDVGIDGVPNTDDYGEGDKMPTPGRRLPSGALDPLYPGEPNFELTDLDEADQNGLTSFNSWTWNTDAVKNDESMWFRCRPQNFSEIQQNADIVFIFSSGPISLKKGETKRISMALLFGDNLDDLLTTAETVQRIYNANYRFFKPPAKPTVTAVPGDKKVTLFWDTKSEASFDPLTGKDFEGYVIYRSTSPDFTDIKKITDGKGSEFLYEPLRDGNGFEAKWDVDKRDEPFVDLNGNGKWDTGEPYNDVNGDNQYSFSVDDWWKDYHPVDYRGRGVKYFLGNNRGLVHSFVDSNNVINGQTYYYAVVAYDHGDSVGIPPTETTKKITLDPITSQYTFDVNTVSVIPGPRASGYVPPVASSQIINHTNGISTSDVVIEVLNDLDVKDNAEYKVYVKDSLTVLGKKIAGKNFSILKLTPQTDQFTLYDTNYTKLSKENLVKDEVLVVKDLTGKTYQEGVDYVLDYTRGLIRRTSTSSMSTKEKYQITYMYHPIYESQNINFEDNNPIFDGMRFRLKDPGVIAVDTNRTRWIKGNSKYTISVKPASIGQKINYPADYEISFSSNIIDSAMTLLGSKMIKIPVKYTVKEVTSGIPKPIVSFLKEVIRDSAWSPGEEIILFKPGSKGLVSDTTTWGIFINKPADTSLSQALPTDGDVALIATHRPLTKEDVYTFKTNSAKFSNELAKSRLDNIYVVPNPYVGVNVIEPTTKLPGQTRGERRIYFENLPQKCTIRIYTLSGELVRTLEHNSALDNGREYWNLLNRDGFSVAYGIYFAHIDAEGIGEKIIKFAIIK